MAADSPLPPHRTRILVVDDHALLRAGLVRLLESRPDFEVVGEAADGEDALVKSVALAPDIVLMDLVLPGLGGVGAIRRLLAAGSAARVLVVSQLTSPAAVEEALRAGAHGYLAKHAGPDELLRAIDAVRSGSDWISPGLSRRGVPALDGQGAQKTQDGDSGAGALSPRERQILTLLASGLSSREIAADLRVSPRTVDTHRVRVMRKLRLHKAPQLVRYAIRAGLITP